MFNDLRYAIRSLLKTPGFTAVALLTLALGIGLNTAVFSFLNIAVLCSLPVPNPQALRVVNWVGGLNNLDLLRVSIDPGKDVTPATLASKRKWGSFNYDTYERFRQHGESGAIIFGFQPLTGNLSTKAGASTVDGLFVSGNFFQGYAVKPPLLGRALAPDDDRKDAPAVAVISYRFWQSEFGLDPGALGQTITVNGLPCAIVGILPSGFADPRVGNPSEIFLPLALRARGGFHPLISNPRLWGIQVMARIAPGTDERQLTASLNVVFSQALLAAKQEKAVGNLKVVLEEGRRGPLSSSVVFDQIAKPAWVLMAAVGLLLLIACANLAGLLLARAATRVRELAIRTAVGASRWRLARLMALENLLLALSGGALGLLFAMGILRAISQGFFSKWLERGVQLKASLDIHVLLFTFGVSLFTALLFGILPVWRTARADPLKGLKSEHPGGSHLKLGGVLVAVQVGISVVLLVGAGLLARTFVNLNTFDPGFNRHDLLLFELKADRASYQGEREAQLYETVRNSLAAVPGVEGATFSSLKLLTGQGNFWLITVPGRATGIDPDYIAKAVADPESYPTASNLTVEDSYFSTMGIPLLQGRGFNTGDIKEGVPVAVVNQEFVCRYLKDQTPIGATFSGYGDQKIYRIVGVSADAKFADIKSKTLPMAYFPLRQMASPHGSSFAIRSRLPPESLGPLVRQKVAAIDPSVSVAGLTTQKILIDRLNSQERVIAIFGGFIAILAALLAGIGLFGLLAYAVSRRTNEIGVRMALGARQQDVTRLILGQGLRSVIVGIGAGVVVALWATQFLRSFLWGVEANDSLTMVGASMLLCLVAAFACFIPARRATRVDPLVALRAE